MIERPTVLPTRGGRLPTGRAMDLLRSARSGVDDLAALPDDWDSYGAARPTERAIATAHDLLTAVWDGVAEAAEDSMVPWATAPLADGGVQFEWRHGNHAIEVEVAPGGALNYLIERDERTVARSDPRQGAPASEVVGQVRRVLAGG